VSTALEMFKQQKKALEDLSQSADRIAESISSTRRDFDALARSDALTELLREEQRWITRVERAVDTVRAWREREERSYWPRIIGRWIPAALFAILAAAASGAGFAWAVKPYADEIRYLRARNAFADALEHRLVSMTPAERRQLDSLLQLPRRTK
jgi:hypothetical protein